MASFYSTDIIVGDVQDPSREIFMLITHNKVLGCKRMIRCLSPHPGVFFAAILYSVAICSVSRPVAAWGPPHQGSSPISPALLATGASHPSSSKGEENRKSFLLKSVSSCLGLFLVSTEKVAAAETVGKDLDCDEQTCLGVWDGLLAGEYTHR